MRKILEKLGTLKQGLIQNFHRMQGLFSCPIFYLVPAARARGSNDRRPHPVGGPKEIIPARRSSWKYHNVLFHNQMNLPCRSSPKELSLPYNFPEAIIILRKKQRRTALFAGNARAV